jgi:tetratricopeptide (TPR) repeat protein
MQKFLVALCLLLVSICPVVFAQDDREQARIAEWKQYQLPDAPYSRFVGPDSKFIFRIPADWKKPGSELTFVGPHSSMIRVVTEKIPDGYPLPNYVAAFMRALDGVSGAEESLVSRRTEFQDLEAREISFETQGPDGDQFRSVTWVTTIGPDATIFILQTPAKNASEIEPFFKGVIQSVSFTDAFALEQLEVRQKDLKRVASPIKEFQNVLAELNQTNSNRAAAIDRLASIFNTSPDMVLDLFLDRRPIVRAAAVEALSRSSNSSYEPFLWDALNDREIFAAAIAARRLAQIPEFPAKLLAHSMSGFATEPMARVWPFMSKENRLEILKAGFKQTAVPTSPPPPAPARRRKSDVTVSVEQLKPIMPGAAVSAPNFIPPDPNIQMGLLTLMADDPVADFQVPLDRLMAANYDPLVIVGLQVANFRSERLPLEPLFKLAGSANQQVRTFALQNLSCSAGVAEIPRIEALSSKNPSDSAFIKKVVEWIRLQDQLQKNVVPKPEVLKTNVTIKPFAENLFPQRVTHYLSIPNPAQAVDKFYNSLRSIQMDSPRAQSSLVLAMSSSRQQLGLKLSAPAEAPSLIDYTGIKSDAPINLAEWPAEEPVSPGTLRKAIVLRIADRERFERTVQVVQRDTTGFSDLTDYVAVGARAMAAWPALLPLVAKSILREKDKKLEKQDVIQFSAVRYTKLDDLEVKVFLQRRVDNTWQVETTATYFAMIGDTAILAPNLATIREMLNRASATQTRGRLEDSENFRQLKANDGDVVYFSDVKAMLERFEPKVKDDPFSLTESGALQISNTSWENSHRFDLKDNAWSRYLLPFSPKDLSAPRELLPNSTVAYFFLKPNVDALWQRWAKDNFGETESKALASLAKEIVPELGPECGMALMNLPDVDKLELSSWAAFCRMKSNKPLDALRSSELAVKGGAPDAPIEIKLEKQSYFVNARNGFLVISNTREGVKPSAAKATLAESRDYARAAEKVSNEVLVFGGYNLEAAIAEARAGNTEGGLKSQIAEIVFSLAGAFHSQYFSAAATTDSVQAKSSVGMDREGKYGIASFAPRVPGTNITYATLTPRGAAIVDQNRVSKLVMRFQSKAPGPIDNLRDDLKTPDQIVEQKSATELLLTVMPRRNVPNQKITLPVTDPKFAEFLKATNEIASEDKSVIEQARQISGDDKDAWSVARKLSNWTYKNLKWKFTAVAKPGQTLETHEADCSEFSQLYISMARSLGLPARMVSGLAYGGGSFGGHAWVEVWVGRWIELDPTWGTDYVDATHIREESFSLVTSAALNLIDIEILEANRSLADFKKTPQALANELSSAFTAQNVSVVETAFDLKVLADEFMGAGEWDRMTDAERNLISAGYKRALLEIIVEFGKDRDNNGDLRFLNVEERGELADVLFITPKGHFLKFRLAKRNEGWHLIEIVDTENGFHLVAESLRPFIKEIKSAREAKTGPKKTIQRSLFARAVSLSGTDSKKALELVEGALTEDPSNQDFLFLKAQLLMNVEKKEEGLALFRKLSNEQPVYPAALLHLATWIEFQDKHDPKEVLDLNQRYTKLEPLDPSGHMRLGSTYTDLNEPALAISEYRKALECDPDAQSRYYDLVYLLTANNLFDKVAEVFELGDKHPKAGQDLFGFVMSGLVDEEEYEAAQKMAASQPVRLRKSVAGNIALGQSLIETGKALRGLGPLNLAVQLDKESVEARLALAGGYQALGRWSAVLKVVDETLSMDYKNVAARYLRACALARLGRRAEAMEDLNKALALEPDRKFFLAYDSDLQPLSVLPAYKKLLAEAAAEAELKKKEAPK